MNLLSTDHTNDKLLLIQIQQGNKRAFNVLYEKYWEQAYLNAYKRLKDDDQARDIVQEIFVAIWLRREIIIDNFPAYISVAIRNKVFKLVEKQKKFHPFFYKLQEVSESDLYADSTINTKELNIAYEALINNLPLKRQKIFRLRFQEDLPTITIADKLGLSRKTVQNQLGKAIEQLRISLLQLFIFVFILLNQ